MLSGSINDEHMENLIIEATEYTPAISFDCRKHVLAMHGKSYPENTSAFYTPVLAWVEKYFSQLERGTDVTVNIEIVYFNSGSSKALLDFFDLLGDAAFKNIEITIYWMYEEGDDDMFEYGQEFEEDFKGLTFHFVPKTL